MLRLLVFLYLSTKVDSAKILAVFPTPSVSHQVIFRPLTQELARRGHEVTVITTDPVFKNNKPANLTEIDVHDVSYELWKKYFVFKMEFGKKDSIYPQIETLSDLNMKIVVLQLEQESVKKLINEKNNFDLLLLEAWPRQALIFSHIFKAPVILVSSLGTMFANDEENVGAPSHPFLYPMMLQQKLYNLTFWDKIHEFYTRQWFNTMWYKSEAQEIEIFRKMFGKDVPNYDVLRNNIDILFLNTHPMWINNQPLPPNVLSIWGIHRNPEKPLPFDLQKYLDSSTNGVIYLSFGSNALSSVLSPDKIQIFIKVFSKLSYDILWKWETDELPGKSENIKIAKWIPQSGLLKHPKVKLFITQGGLQSTDEAIRAGVPMIGVPMLGDQWFNVEKYMYYKIGLKLEMEDITEEELEMSVRTIINDKSYKENILRLRTLMYDQPEGALQRAVWWSEYVLRHGGAKHLRAAGANLSFVHYYEVEFLFKLLLLVSSVTGVVLIFLYFMYRKLKTFMTRSKVKVS